MSLLEIQRLMQIQASPEQAAILRRFFKTGPGEYGEGDVFLGLKVPQIRQLVKQSDALSIAEIKILLHSKFHEERLLALLIIVRRFERGPTTARQELFNFYLRSTPYINNWDLVDTTAPQVIGGWLLENPRDVLDGLIDSGNLWERRIAVLATLTFIRHGQFDDTLRLCRRRLDDPHDLMHKACGWMLREVGKRDQPVLEKFLDTHAVTMPRTMLRYAIERLPEPRRKAYLERRQVFRRQLSQTNS
jgi:3-methyladenine DNA glycosylase AlkD